MATWDDAESPQLRRAKKQSGWSFDRDEIARDFSQLGLMLWKNALLKRRRPLSTLFELFLPAALMSIIMVGYFETGRDIYDPTLYTELETSIPPFDDFAAYRYADQDNTYLLSFAPGSPDQLGDVQDFVTYMQSTYPNFGLVFGEIFNSEDELLEYATNQEDVRKELWAGIIFRSTGPSWEYAIRMNSTEIPWTGWFVHPLQVVPTDWRQAYDDYGRRGGVDFDDYLESGWASIQFAIDQYIINLEASRNGNPAPQVSLSFLPFPTPEYKENSFYEALGGILGLFISMAYIWPVSRLVKNIVEEKESKIKEGMKMMGLKSWVFGASWLVTYLIMFMFSGTLVTLILAPTIFNHCDSGLIWVTVMMFSFSVVGFCFLAAVFFDKAKVAASVVPLAFLVSTMPEVAFNDDSTPGSRFVTGLFLSPTGFSFAMQILVDYEAAQKGVTWDNLYDGDWSYGFALWSIILSTLLYFFAAWYLAMVLPSEYGTHLPWYFLFTRTYWFGEDEQLERQPLLSPTGINATTSAFTAQIEQVAPELEKDALVRIQNLRKVYDTTEGPKVAVEGLNLSFYKGQITALLGHNGAGKTTTMSMLTGLYPPTSGDALIDGMSINSQMNDIRQNMGVCPQHDILFDLLTVEEHLELFAGLKNVPKHQIKGAVAKMIADVGLDDKARTYSTSLSGGMKRKLSVGIALIGDSRIVFLDEPTSGMDPYSRRATWDLLQRVKKDRAIVLTTHFMDEADLLGDRIAIMQRGQLRCCGSSLFLKSRYGVGYNMTVAKAPGYDHMKFTGFVKQYVPAANLLSNVGTEVTFQLPMSSLPQFPEFFRHLEEHGTDLHISSYGVSVTTLEEVFIRLADDHDMDPEAKLADKRKTQEISARRSMDVKSGKATPVHDLQRDYDREVDQNPFWRHYRAMLTKRIIVGKRDRRAQFFQVVLPVLAIIFFMTLLEITAISDPAYLDMSMSESEDPYGIPYTSSAINDAFLNNNLVRAEDKAALEPATASTTLELSQFILDTYSVENPLARAGGFVFNPTFDPSNFVYNVSILHNQTFFHSTPVFQSMISGAILNSATGVGGYSILLKNEPWPLTDNQREFIDAIISVFAAIFVLLPYCFLPANFVVFLVKERENKAKHIQLVSGVSVYAYWAANMTWDLIMFAITSIGTIIVFLAFDKQEFIGNFETFAATFFLFVFYGLAVIPWTFCWSFAFTNPSSAQNAMLMINFLAGFVTVQASFILGIINSTKDINDVLVFFYRLLPPYCLGEGILNLSSLQFGPGESPWTLDTIGYNLIYLAAEGVLLYALTFVFEAKEKEIGNILVRRITEPKDPRVLPNEDADVAAERSRVGRGEADNDIICLKNLRKVYPPANGNPPKIAVHDLSIGIPAGECFGFLGVNGAGKTTTLSVLTGDYLPTSGTAILANMDIHTHQSDIRRLMGYCPQFDALIELMTGREHLEMYARIKGIPEPLVGEAVESSLHQLDLVQYAGKASGTYSGGNKRKLSVAIALLGNPKIVFLDEPSTGMDPVARRFMWDVISNTMTGRSVILTTHSMEECEALCTRIGIMVGGRLTCLGSGQHLKSRFGDGYQMEISSAPEATDNVRRFLEQTFPGARMLEAHGGQVKYDVPKQALTLSGIFAKIEAERERLQIIDYAVCQTTLEQIFIQKAKYPGAENPRN
eukprot:TRINITY_DN818_c0_g1_i1.p1 TRINITY_DN818_c0_g1~~TRINITY_DN818_c0_g1_i1.p1  ORF type:complete len:1668 (-),score=437.00 TRINITY_DN818_c0_g1_i1:51-5054(-)